MNQAIPPLPEAYHHSQRQSLWTGYAILCLMMTSVGIAITQFSARLSPGWNGAYLVGICFLVTLEAIYTKQRAKEMDSGERLWFHLSEAVAFAVLIKVLLYLIHNPAQLTQDIGLWQTDFLRYFLTVEYLLSLGVVGLVWFLTRAYVEDMESLYIREADAEWDEVGKLQNALQEIRARLASRVFFVGTFLVILAIATRIDANPLLYDRAAQLPDDNLPVINVLGYFVLGLLLLSQTQLSLLRTRWAWQRVPISAKISSNWFKYGLLFFGLLSVIVFFLPTRYSVGLFESLQIVIGGIMQVLAFLLFLILLPFTFCMSLFRLSSAPAGAPPAAPPQIIPAAPPGHPLAWLEILRSIAFWLIFLGVIFFALRYYLLQNTRLWNALRKIPLLSWFGRVWKGFSQWLRGANKKIRALVQEGIQRLRPQRMTLAADGLRGRFNRTPRNPREKIILYYLELLDFAREHGLPRNAAQTPYHFEDTLRDQLPENDSDIHALTHSFMEARYSQHAIPSESADQASHWWQRIKDTLQQWRK